MCWCRNVSKTKFLLRWTSGRISFPDLHNINWETDCLLDITLSSIYIRSFSGQKCYCCRYLDLKYFHLSVLSQACIDRTDCTGRSSFFVLDSVMKEKVSHKHEGSRWYIYCFIRDILLCKNSISALIKTELTSNLSSTYSLYSN